MNKKMKFLVFTTMLTFAFHCGAATAGKPAPAFEAKLLNGEKYTLSQKLGRVVLIHFWATWCDACKTEMPALDSFYKKHHSVGLDLIAISMDNSKDEEKMRSMAKDFSFQVGKAKDASFKAYGRIWRLPLSFVIDRKGILQKDGWAPNESLNLTQLEKEIGPFLK